MWLAVDGADYPLAFMLVDGEMIEALFVDPAYQGQGAGGALIEQAVLLGGGKRVDVNEGNPQALAFIAILGSRLWGDLL
jgi:putative acetyltransferase